MSLHQLANHMSARGRGPDSTLVHMSPREVEGLQKLAVAHGTTLTINPDTGLPEAFSLQDLLPTLIGGAATYLTGGAITPLMAALGTGAVTALTSKDLGKGLMAGLGAYGGAGIVSGLAGFGAEALGSEAATAALPSGISPLSEQAASYEIGQAAANKAAQTGASYADKFGAGISKAMSDPMGAASAIGGGSRIAGLTKVAGAISPLLAGETGNTVPTVTPRRPSTPISNERFDPYSQTFERNQPRSNDGYDPYAQLYSRSAAKGGLMSLANGGITLDQMYQNVLGREADTGGKAFWASQFGDEVDANELASFRASALGGTDTADKSAAQNFGISNAGAGFAAAAPVAAQATPAAPPARVAETAPLAAAQVSPQAGAGIAALSNAQAAPAAPVAETAPAPVAQVLPQAAQFSPPDFFDTSQAAQDVRRTFAEQLAKNNANNTGIAALSQAPVKVAETAPIGLNNALANAMSAGTGMTVQDAATKVLGRQLTPTELSNWQDKLGSDVNAAELSRFSVAAQPERGLGVNYTDSNKAIRDMYLERLGRYPDASGLAYFSNKFGPTVEAGERAIFDAMTTEEFNANAEQKRKGLTTVVTDLTTADTEYIAPGGGGATGASQIGGGTTINPNGTITTSPVIPGIPVGGFKGMTGVQKAYTDGGGNLGYTPTFVPTTTAEFDAKYSNTGYSKKMYDYLRGKGPKPTKMTDVDETGKETYREIMRPYKEAVLGLPVNTNTKLNWNKETGKYDRNLDYMRQKTITDPTTKEKSTINYMSINQAKAALAKTPLEGNALANWSIRNFVDPDTLAEATGMTKNQITTLLANAKADKSFSKAEGGLMALANGGLAGVGYASGGLPDKEFTDNTTGIKYYFDFPNGIYRSETTVKDGVTYRWNPLTNKYETGSASGSGIASLLDATDGSPAGGENAPNTTPDWGTTFQIGKTLSNMGLTTAGNYLERAATNGILGQSNQAAKEADALPSTTTGVPQGYDTAASRSGRGVSGTGAPTGSSVSIDYNGGIPNPDTGLQGQGYFDGQTGLYGDAAAGTGISTNSAVGTSGGAATGTSGGSPADAGNPADAGGPAGPATGNSGGSPADAGSDNSANGGMVGRYAHGGLGSLGGYSDGGRLLRGPGDGVSDSIPASIGNRQPARLADGEFVVPARIVSELGNGSTEAGARALYKMMDRIQANRRKTTGKNSVAVDSKAHKYLPA